LEPAAQLFADVAFENGLSWIPHVADGASWPDVCNLFSMAYIVVIVKGWLFGKNFLAVCALRSFTPRNFHPRALITFAISLVPGQSHFILEQ
jgi:hypothetical protein